MNKTLKLSAVFALALALPVASAQSLQAAQDLYNQGKWQEAANAAAALKTSAGYALAAEATTNGAGLVADAQKKALFAKAQDYANQAIAADKNNADAYFELARAQGRLAQFSGILQSLGMAKDMKKNLDTAIKLNPNMASAYVALGLWNANLAAKGFAATAATGANKSQVVPNFEKAVKLDPNTPAHRLEYGNALLAIGDKAGAKAQFQKAASMTADNFWEKRDVAAAAAKAK
ncbi:hypothetical protein WDJ50_01405 [Deinococcus sp. VB142]|uniref:Tetratricopeptide repeat protein n=1 Tax=Deinococcus sp. VB142 TaxID=3112952 RepID=A0AAU6Q390_9DEIO